MGRARIVALLLAAAAHCAAAAAAPAASKASPAPAARTTSAAQQPAQTGVANSPTMAPWKIDAAHSSIEFSATQAGAKFDGKFGQWSADVRWDANDLAHSHALVTVLVGSVSTQSADRDNALKSKEWFDPARWPKAVFETSSIRATAAGYEADGRLTIRDRIRPVKFAFKVTPAGNDSVRLEGTAHLQRLEFDLGQGEFKSTEWVGNDVDVRVVVSARTR